MVAQTRTWTTIRTIKRRRRTTTTTTRWVAICDQFLIYKAQEKPGKQTQHRITYLQRSNHPWTSIRRAQHLAYNVYYFVFAWKVGYYCIIFCHYNHELLHWLYEVCYFIQLYPKTVGLNWMLNCKKLDKISWLDVTYFWEISVFAAVRF